GVQNLLTAEGTATKFYDHPLIKSLYRDKRRPSYIPSRTFALALLDMVAETKTTISTAEDRMKQLREALAGEQVSLPPPVVKTLTILLTEAGNDLDKFQKSVGQWFDDAMERVSGWYKRKTQAILLALAIILTIGVNADTIAIVGTLWRDPAVRTAMVAQAQAYVAEQQSNRSQQTGQPSASSEAVPP